LGIFRALGWYAVLPLLVYVTFRLWKAKSQMKRRWLLIMACVVIAWTLISSTRAGGDQWDNPRYRTIFLPWMALLSGWGISFAQTHKDRWLTRILLMDGVFIALFLVWYGRRYWSVDLSLGLPDIVIMIVGISLVIIIIGWIWDRKHPNSALTQEGG
jgi:peptidoglycan/LPS O-acetylase OafA/YrhL